MAVAILGSCNKESITTVEDNIPEVSPQEVFIPLAESEVTSLVTFIQDSTVNNYSLSIPSSFVGAPGARIGVLWSPLTPEETELQMATYQGFDVEILSQEGKDAFDEWEANGSDPATEPDYFQYLEKYSSSLYCEISNIGDSTVDVRFLGSITDSIPPGAGIVYHLSDMVNTVTLY